MASEVDVIRFDALPSLYWDDCVKISYLQRRIIVYSIMYYEFDESCVSDSVYDGVSRQLVRLQQSAGKAEFERSRYYYAMYDFDGSTGFDIPSRLSKADYAHLRKVATMVYNQWKGR